MGEVSVEKNYASRSNLKRNGSISLDIDIARRVKVSCPISSLLILASHEELSGVFNIRAWNTPKATIISSGLIKPDPYSLAAEWF